MKDKNYSVPDYPALARASVCAFTAFVFIHSSSFAAEAGYITPLTEFGVPDMQGTWSLATQTNLERADRFAGQAGDLRRRGHLDRNEGKGANGSEQST